jgi:hypothetical protein
VKGWVGEGELREINALLDRLVLLFKRGPARGRRQLFSFTFVTAPLPARAPRRQGAASVARRPR